MKERSPLETWLLENGYPALFVLSLLASSLVPLGSEWLVAVLLLNGFEAAPVVAVATLGNTLGALTTYAIGLWGGVFLIRRVLRISAAAQVRAEEWFRRYGCWALLLSWLPVVGDPLCLAGGVLKISPWQFLLLVAIGKGMRYLVVAWLVMTGNGTLPI